MGAAVLNFSINLERLCLFKIAETLWGNPHIQNEIEAFAKDVYIVKSIKDAVVVERKWHERNIHEKVMDLMKLLCVPEEFEEKLEHNILLLGHKVFEWVDMIMMYFKMKDARFYKKIHWTGYGVVDDHLNFQYWKKEMIFRDFIGDNYTEKVNYYFLACAYADVGVVQVNLKDIAKTIEKCLKIKIKDLKVNTAMTILLCWYFSSSRQVDFKDMYSNLKSEKYPTGVDSMFFHCVIQRYTKAADYFYNKLKDEDKPKIVHEAALKSIKTEYMNPNISQEPERTQKTIIYIFKKMSEKSLKIFLSEELMNLQPFFLLGWPYMELLNPIINYVWQDLPTNNRLSVLENTIKVYTCYDSYNYFECWKVYHDEILMNVLSKLSLESKVTILKDGSQIFNLFEKSQFATIQKIINDSDLKPFRSKLINISVYLAEYLKNGGTCENIKNFMEELKFSKEEKQRLLKFCNIKLFESLMFSHLDSALDVLEWQCHSNEEKIVMMKRTIRMNLNFMEDVCSYYVKEFKYDLLEKYLKWLANWDEQEVKKLIPNFFLYEFLRDQFIFMWIKHRVEKNLEATKKICLELLDFYSRISGQSVSVMKVKLLEDTESFFGRYVNRGCVHCLSLEEMFEFLNIPAEKVKMIKNQVKKNIDEYVEDCPTEIPGRFLTLHSLINWVGTEEEKNAIMKRHVNSLKGAEFCIMISYFSRSFDNSFDQHCRIFFLEWVRPNGDIKKIEQNMKKLKDGKFKSALSEAVELLELCKKQNVKVFLKAIGLM